MSSDSGEDDISGRAFCKAYQHFFFRPSRGHCILCFSLLLFSDVFLPFTLWYFPVFPPSDSLHNLFSFLVIPRLLLFPLSRGIVSSLLYQPFIKIHTALIILPSIYLLNDLKMHLCAQHLRCSHCRRFIFLLALLSYSCSFSLSFRERLEKSSYSLLVIIGSDNQYFGSVHAGHMKDKLPNIYHCTFQKRGSVLLNVETT